MRTKMAFLTLGYHAKWSLAPENHNFTIAYGESYCTACDERINGEAIPEQEVPAKMMSMN
jgi:hypothetical protein